MGKQQDWPQSVSRSPPETGSAPVPPGSLPPGLWAAELLGLIGLVASDYARAMVRGEDDESVKDETMPLARMRLGRLLRRARHEWWHGSGTRH